MNLMQAAASFIAMSAEYEKGKHDALEAACVVIEEEAKRVIGTYDYGWPPLAPSTIADRVSKGFTPDDPLLRTGAMRDSIEHKVEGNSGFVGSDDDKAVWQELGTSRGIPPRSFLGGAAAHKGQEAANAAGLKIYEHMTGGLKIGPFP